MRELNTQEVNALSGGAYLDANGNVVIVPDAGKNPTNADGFTILGCNTPLIVGSTRK